MNWCVIWKNKIILKSIQQNKNPVKTKFKKL